MTTQQMIAKKMTAKEAEAYITTRLDCRDSVLVCEVRAFVNWATSVRFQPSEQRSLLDKLEEYRHLMDEAGCRILDEALGASSSTASSLATA